MWPPFCLTTSWLLKKHLTSGTELILIGWKIVPNEEHVQCDHRFASQPLSNEPMHSSQLFGTGIQKSRGITSLCRPWSALNFLASFHSNNFLLTVHVVPRCRSPNPCLPQQQDTICCKNSQSYAPKDGQKVARNMLSWSYSSINYCCI